MDFQFVIDKKFILGGILFNNKRKNPYVDIQNKLWGKYRDAYDLLNHGTEYRMLFNQDTDQYFDKLKVQIHDLMKEGVLSPEVEELYKQTIIYKDWMEKTWKEKKGTVEKELKSILKIDLPDTTFEVVLVPYVIGGGRYLGNNKIFWGDLYGDEERFPNYNLVYLGHEALHSIFPKSDIDHALIELATDNELRIRLNHSGDYFVHNGCPTGHDYLIDIEKKMLKEWQQYLQNPSMDIFQFKETLNKK